MKKIYCSLDEIFDSRLGLMSMIDQEKTSNAIYGDQPEYLYRMHDSYLAEALGITEEEWYQRWDNRTVEVLKNSICTHIVEIIGQSCFDYFQSDEEALGTKYIRLDINTYPYEFDLQDQQALTDVLKELTPLVNEVNYVNYTLETLTSEVLKQYDECYLYEFHRWMDIHGEKLKGKYFLNMHLFVPRLFWKKMTDKDYTELTKSEEGKMLFDLDIFKVFEAALSPQFQLTYIAASDFSAAIFEKVRKTSTVPDLDQCQNPSVFETVDTFQADPRSSSHPQSTASEGSS